MKRIRSTRQAADELGMTYKSFLALRSDKTFPKPVHQRKHHLFWDMKAIHNYFDKLGNIEAESLDYDSIAQRRLNGEGQRALSQH